MKRLADKQNHTMIFHRPNVDKDGTAYIDWLNPLGGDQNLDSGKIGQQSSHRLQAKLTLRSVNDATNGD